MRFFISHNNNTQKMEPENPQTHPSSYQQLSPQKLRTNLKMFCQDPTQIQIWHQIIAFVQKYIKPTLPISEQAQKAINSFIKQSTQLNTSLLNIIKQKKVLISNIYDILMKGDYGNIEYGCISGEVGEHLLQANKNLLEVSKDIEEWKILCCCVESIGIYLCSFMNCVKDEGILDHNYREMFCYMKNSQDFFSCRQTLAHNLFGRQICLLVGYLNNVKPIIVNYLNIQSLLEATNKNFNNKQCIFCCVNENENNQQDDILEGMYVARVLKIQSLLGNNTAGRKSIEASLMALKPDQILELSSRKWDAGWTLTTLPQQFQSHLFSIIQKIPDLLKPKSSSDIFSYYRFQHQPTFRYQLIKPIHIQGPFLTTSPLVFMNAGKLPFQIISYSASQSDFQSVPANIKPLNFQTHLKAKKIKYGKVLLTSRNLAVVPGSHYYLIGCREQRQFGFAQVISWNILPKYSSEIQKFLKVTSYKKKTYKGEIYEPPISLMLFDFLNHELLNFKNDLKLPQLIIDFLEKLLVEEQNIMFQALKKVQEPKISPMKLSEEKKFCDNCLGEIINYFAFVKHSKETICMGCLKQNLSLSKIQQKYKFRVLYAPQDLRFPIHLAKLLIRRRATFSEIQNRYENNICGGSFIGSIESESCKGPSTVNEVFYQEGQYQRHKAKNKYFHNQMQEYGIVPPEKRFQMNALKSTKDQKQKEQAQKELKRLSKLIKDKQEMKQILFPKYSADNLVLFSMCYLQNLNGLV